MSFLFTSLPASLCSVPHLNSSVLIMDLLQHASVHVHFLNFRNRNWNRNKNRNRNPCLINQSQNQNHFHHHAVSVSVSVSSVAARDRVIDFGKYKGKMLGSVPSTYLKWVSKNLRAGDFEEWANLADQVLRDPIYRDRIEWEFALNVLTGDAKGNANSLSSSSLLEEISERFGWDTQDKVRWSQVNFDLLGTSKGGRIPRLMDTQHKHHPPTPTPAPAPAPAPSPSSAQLRRRMDRRERQKTRLRITETEAQQHKKNNNINMDIHAKDEIDGQKQNQNDGAANLFPGRQALLRAATGWKALK